MGNETAIQQWRCSDYFLFTLHKLELPVRELPLDWPVGKSVGAFV